MLIQPTPVNNIVNLEIEWNDIFKTLLNRTQTIVSTRKIDLIDLRPPPLPSDRFFWKKATAIREDNVSPQRHRAAQKETGTVFPSIARAYTASNRADIWPIPIVRRSYSSPTRSCRIRLYDDSRVHPFASLKPEKMKTSVRVMDTRKRRRKKAKRIYIYMCVCISAKSA